MKKFLIGFLAAILICTLAVGALAATGKLSIEVNTDMKIRVNGEVFAPTDANGNPVMVFEYNGTTYAPLRALAEAYGLEVGYDAASRMATVDEAVVSVEPTPEKTELVIPEGSVVKRHDIDFFLNKGVSPDRIVFFEEDLRESTDAFYDEFVSMWDVEYGYSYDDWLVITKFTYNGDLTKSELGDLFAKTAYVYPGELTADTWTKCGERLWEQLKINNNVTDNSYTFYFEGEELLGFYGFTQRWR